MALRSRPALAVVGLAVGALLTMAGCGSAPRQAVPAPKADVSAPTTAPTTLQKTVPTTAAPSAPQPGDEQTGPTATAPAPTTAGPAAPKQDAPETDASENSTSKQRTGEKQSAERQSGDEQTDEERTPPRQAQPAAIMKSGSAGDQVRELQHRLRQLKWFAGSITGSYGASTTKGVTGFQEKRDLRTTGEVDKKTWTTLTGMTREPTRDEMFNKIVAGPAIMKSGANGERVRNLQARLKQLEWFTGEITGVYGSVTAAGVRGFQGKRGLLETGEVDQKTWDKLTGMTKTPTKDAMYNRVPAGQDSGSARGLDPRCLTGRVMCISKANNSITWVVDGKAKLRMDVRFGSDETPTRNGSFNVFRKTRNGVSTLYRTRMPWAMTFSGGQAVHYSPDFAARGYNGASHGCVNVRDYDGVKWLWHQVRLGDKVVVYA